MLPGPSGKRYGPATGLTLLAVAATLAVLIVVPTSGAGAAPSAAPLPGTLPLPPGARLPFEGTKFYTGGPHDSDDTGGSDGTYHEVLVEEADGIDFSGGEFEVLAIADGAVIAAEPWDDESDGKGAFVGIEHDNGVVSEYWHLSAISEAVRERNGKPGEAGKVTAGFVLGKAGKTGNQTSVHLHLRLRAQDSSKKVAWHGQELDGYTFWMHRVADDQEKGFNYQGSATWGEAIERGIALKSCKEGVQERAARAMVSRPYGLDVEQNAAKSDPVPRSDPNTLFAEACPGRVQAEVTAKRSLPSTGVSGPGAPGGPGAPQLTGPSPEPGLWDRIARLPGDIATWTGEQAERASSGAREKWNEGWEWAGRAADERWKQIQEAGTGVAAELWRQAEVALASVLEWMAREAATQAEKTVREMCGAAFLPPIAFAVLSLVRWRRRP